MIFRYGEDFEGCESGNIVGQDSKLVSAEVEDFEGGQIAELEQALATCAECKGYYVSIYRHGELFDLVSSYVEVSERCAFRETERERRELVMRKGQSMKMSANKQYLKDPM